MQRSARGCTLDLNLHGDVCTPRRPVKVPRKQEEGGRRRSYRSMRKWCSGWEDGLEAGLEERGSTGGGRHLAAARADHLRRRSGGAGTGGPLRCFQSAEIRRPTRKRNGGEPRPLSSELQRCSCERGARPRGPPPGHLAHVAHSGHARLKNPHFSRLMTL